MLRADDRKKISFQSAAKALLKEKFIALKPIIKN